MHGGPGSLYASEGEGRACSPGDKVCVLLLPGSMCWCMTVCHQMPAMHYLEQLLWTLVHNAGCD